MSCARDFRWDRLFPGIHFGCEEVPVLFDAACFTDEEGFHILEFVSVHLPQEGS